MLVEAYRRISLDENDDPYYRLTAREGEILRLINGGYESHTIAAELHISVKTVLRHRAKINRKLDVHNKSKFMSHTVRKHLANIES
ncbi:LuxR C-terminal-related transcriptional regulator [Chloroflexota bacterium]